MAQKSPRNTEAVKNLFPTEETVAVKDSTVYQFRKWNYLVKKQTAAGGDNELLVWVDDLAAEGWELVSQSLILGFYIFRKPAQ